MLEIKATESQFTDHEWKIEIISGYAFDHDLVLVLCNNNKPEDIKRIVEITKSGWVNFSDLVSLSRKGFAVIGYGHCLQTAVGDVIDGTAVCSWRLFDEDEYIDLKSFK